MIITVSIVEDDVKYSSILRKFIDAEKGMECISFYDNGRDALNNLVRDNPDVVLMDIQLPDAQGTDLVLKLKEANTNMHFVMCTSFDDDENVFTSLKNGAEGYIVKSSDPEEAIGAIREVIKGGAPMSMRIAKKVLEYFHNIGQKTKKLNALTNRENQVLLQLAEGKLYKEIANENNISIDTVKKHAGNIYRKLHVANKTEAINLLKK